MKKIIKLSVLLMFCGGCVTSAELFTPAFETFQIRKIVENGIQSVEIGASKKEWPEVNYQGISALDFNSTKLKMAVIGDTGCRLKEAKGKVDYQNCNSSDEWPYPQVVQTLVKENYDFAIHTGDYHYREKCTDKILCPKYTKSVGYGWDAWWDDFYGPSLSLFKKSPVMFIRGNHEDCTRAYSGWGPLSVKNKKFEDRCEDIEPYQWVEIGDLVLINFDDSVFQDRKPSADDVRERWIGVLRGIADRISALPSQKEIWFLTHKPVAGFVPDSKKTEPFAIEPYLKKIMIESGLLKKIDFFLSGHIHNQQLVFFNKDSLQIIVGHSGSTLDSFGRKIKNHKMISTTSSKTSFGYALFERKGFKQWEFVFKNVAGKTELTCQVKSSKVKCE